MTSIESELFRQCAYLETVTIPNSVKTIYYNAFYGCGSLTTINIPNSVKTIDNNAFEYSGLTSVTIGNGVTKIGAYAFKDCTKLTDFTCLAEAVPNTNSDAFKNTTIGKATLHVPLASVEAYAATEPWSGFKSVVATAPKCATPVITVKDGKLTFSCETEGVEFVSEASFINGPFAANNNELILAGTTTAYVSVYATKDGYIDSDTATADVELNVGKKGDVNQDGVVSITDAVSVVNIILNGGE